MDHHHLDEFRDIEKIGVACSINPTRVCAKTAPDLDPVSSDSNFSLSLLMNYVRAEKKKDG